jgi:hypothetical protein
MASPCSSRSPRTHSMMKRNRRGRQKGEAEGDDLADDDGRTGSGGCGVETVGGVFVAGTEGGIEEGSRGAVVGDHPRGP